MSCGRNMQEIRDAIKRPSLRIMDIEEGEEVQTKEICNIFYKITENFPNLEKVLPIQVQETSRMPNRLDQNRTSIQHIIIITSTENRERILKAVREKKQIMYKNKSIKITADSSVETLKARRTWNDIFHPLNENNFSPRILYQAKLSSKIDAPIQIFHNKQKQNQYIITKPPLQKILQGILHTEDESKQNFKKMESIKSQEKKIQVIREWH
jgi:hypothetical protein